MLKKYKKITGLLLAVCMVLGLAACGNGGAAPDTDAVSDTAGMSAEMQTEATGTEAATEAQTEAEAPEVEAEAATEAAGGESGEETQNDTPDSLEESTALVCYFSATGNTEAVAEKLMIYAGADLYKIKPEEPYTDADLDYSDDQSRTSVEMNDPDARPAIGGEDVSLDGYNVVFLGYPIWWGEAPRIMSTFVESHDFDGITVIPFCTSGGSGIGDSAEILEEQAGSGTWLEGTRFDGDASDEEVQEWVAGIDLKAE